MGVDFYKCETCKQVRNENYIRGCESCDKKVCEDCASRMTPEAFERTYDTTRAKTQYEARVRAELNGTTLPPSDSESESEDEDEEEGDDTCSYCPECTDPPYEDCNVSDTQLNTFLLAKAGYSSMYAAQRACRRQLVVDQVEQERVRSAQKKAAAKKKEKQDAAPTVDVAATVAPAAAATAAASSASAGSKRKRAK